MSPGHIGLALLVVVIWGFNFVVIKIGLQGLPPLLFSSLRFACAALPAIFFVARPKVPWGHLLGYAMTQFALQFALLFFGLRLGMPAGLASLVIQLQVFFTIGMAAMMLAERPRFNQVAGALIALAGMALVGWELRSPTTLTGLVLVIAAGVSWATANLITKRMPVTPALPLVVWGSALATVPLFAVSLFFEGPTAISSAITHMGLVGVAAVLYQSYPNTLFGFGVWSVLIQRYPAAVVTPYTLLVPVVGLLSGMVVLGEALSWWKIVAGVLVVSGLALNQTKRPVAVSATGKQAAN